MNRPARGEARWPLMGVAAVVVMLACTDQSLGPDREFQIQLLGNVPADSLSGGPADTLALTLQVVDQDGRAISGAEASYAVQGNGALVLPGAVTTSLDGRLSVGWQLGTRSTDQQQL